MTEFRLKAAITLAVLVVDVIWIAAAGFSFDVKSLAECLSITAVVAAIAFVYVRLRPDERLGTMCVETGYLLLFSAAACVFSYLVTSLDRPLIDTFLVKSDKLLGFDWYRYVAFANAHSWIGILSSLVYQTTLPQVALAIVVLSLMGRVERAREMTLVVMVSSILCIVLSGIFPSAGALAYYHPDASFYMQNNPVVDLAYKQEFFDVRSGAMTHLSLRDVHGLIAFPSYHVGLSVIVVAAFRGLKTWFWPLAALNLLVMLSTPIDGGHHLSDGLGGIALALVSIVLVVKVRRHLSNPMRTPQCKVPVPV